MNAFILGTGVKSFLSNNSQNRWVGKCSYKEKAIVKVVIWNIYTRGRISIKIMFSNACVLSHQC